VKFAYADPPYLGCCKLYGHHHPDKKCWDDLETHAALIDRLCREYPDGWALSLHSPSLQRILGRCPLNVRVAAWVKPFAIFKPNVNPAYAWEPVIFRGGRKLTRDDKTIRDFVSANVTLQRGTTGAKPEAFSYWLFDVLNMRPDDEFDDLFAGSGSVSRAHETWKSQYYGLFAGSATGQITTAGAE